MSRSAPVRPLGFLAMVIVAVLVVGSWSWVTWDDGDETVVIGVPRGAGTPTTGPSIPPPPAEVLGRVETPPTPAPVLAQPAGHPWPAAIPFTSSIPVSADLVFVLAIGSDARPGQDPLRARADSIHLLAANPSSGEGTIVGLPRDSWVDVPGHGRRKLTESLALGGPDLVAQTVRNLTGLPVHYYVVTGFEGFTRLVDDLGGVDVPVPYRMDDAASGARFEAGWHRLDGAAALALARNRKSTPQGDFSRSANQGLIVLSALAKMRGEVGDDAGIHRWLEVLVRHVRLDVPPADLPRLAVLARHLDPDRIDNVVAPGRAGRAGRASVVHLDAPGAAALFEDLRPDGVIGTAAPATTTSTTTTTPPTTTTEAPPPTSTTAPPSATGLRGGIT